jgi:hypothetical protein
MTAEQLDLFASDGLQAPAKTVELRPSRLPATTLDDSTLIAALAWSGMADTLALAAEAGRRRLRDAVPALERLCRRFAGFGIATPVPEQIAALEALAEIGGAAAAQAVARVIARQIVQGPTLAVAARVAGRLEAPLDTAVVAILLAHPSAEIRADACRCARPAPATLATLISMLDDPSGPVRVAAACALGRMGRPEARPLLVERLRAMPSRDLIEAIEPVVDAACLVLLGRIARTVPALADAARDVIEGTDHPHARTVARTLVKQAGGAMESSGTA